MIQSGEVKDPNYTIDEKGRLHYLFKTKGGEEVIRKHNKKGKKNNAGSDESGSEGTLQAYTANFLSV